MCGEDARWFGYVCLDCRHIDFFNWLAAHTDYGSWDPEVQATVEAKMKELFQ